MRLLYDLRTSDTHFGFLLPHLQPRREVPDERFGEPVRVPVADAVRVIGGQHHRQEEGQEQLLRGYQR